MESKKIDNGIIINGVLYEVIGDVGNDLIVCKWCDLRDKCFDKETELPSNPSSCLAFGDDVCFKCVGEIDKISFKEN